MRIDDARIVARDWVARHAVNVPGFRGAYIAGSTNGLPGEAILPATSDIDIMIVLDAVDVPAKPGKFLYHGVLLEATYLSMDLVANVEQVLGHYHLAASLRRPVILADPDGHLTRLQPEVEAAFSRRKWVERRCEQARETALTRIASVIEGRAFEEQVMAWLFAAGGLPHMLLVAGMRNPTVRRRYEATRVLLVEYGYEAFYPGLLALLDPEGISAEQTMRHLVTVGEAFDVASSVISTPFPFAADISAAARPVAIDGSREMIEEGRHREALFWVVATFARCQMVLHADAPPPMSTRWDGSFQDLLADLGIRTFADLDQRCEHIREALPQVDSIAVDVMDASPEIHDD
ncbi:MAG TPA: hypothetical protein VGR29_01355 [Thermomicrobiales bacterium]|nr:hypothetical protein [Thermomicrobiales bacterium]